MSSTDGSHEANAHIDRDTNQDSRGQVHTLLVETLMHLLIEKGVLTKNDALSVVQTVAQVTRGKLHENHGPKAESVIALHMLHRLYASFEAMDDRPGVLHLDGENVRRLRPPVHADRPEFPRDD